ncbi:MAG: DUF4493 domain-containing protein [Parabacteroides sp.]|nr:DUF4493 domain-containing protein [Parabacteroides sp.]
MGEDIIAAPEGSGLMSLTVKAEKPVSTKADDVNTSTFPVKIQGTSDVVKNVLKEYDEVQDVPDVITLPVGTYTVSARQTNGEIPQEMSTPYYAGKTENVVLTNVGLNNVSVMCRMQNNRVQIKCSSEFLATFKDWEVIINDWDPNSGESASGNILTFTSQEWTDGRQMVYWYLGENGAPGINVKVKATTQNDSSVQFSGRYTRANAEEGYEDVEGVNFVGGDAIVITLEPGEKDEPTEGSVGITVTTEIIFSDKEDAVEIPVTDASTTPEPDDDGDNEGDDDTEPIVISEPEGNNYLETGVTYSASDDLSSLNVQIDMAYENGIQNMIVKATTTSETFRNALRSFPALIGDGLDFMSDEAASLKASGLFAFPDPDGKEYSFLLNQQLLGMMSSFPGQHTFTLTVIDKLDNQKEISLVVNVN